METNNKYYKLIAQLLDESIDNSHHTDLYYTKKIAEGYGETYSDFGTVNKHLKDFAKDVGVTIDNKHHPNLYYLKKIAEQLSDDELQYNTENYYLKIISENINPEEKPQGVSFKFSHNEGTVTGYISTKDTLNKYTLENQEVKNLPLLPEDDYYHLFRLFSKLNIDHEVLSQYSTVSFKDGNKVKYDVNGEWIPLEKGYTTLTYTMTHTSIDVTLGE